MAGNFVHSFLSSRQAQYLPKKLLSPIPLSPLQPLLQRMLKAVVEANPGIFNRLGMHRTKRFLIDPVNMPFVLLLVPDPENLTIKAVRRSENPSHDARIAGTFLILLDMIDGNLDGDALFFSRDLIIEGDTEAVVCLRNAMDDLEGSVADDIAGVLGKPGELTLTALRKIRLYDE
ncbi:MAG: sterol-binding protein [Gammaproteobacteria bacterium]|nr:sterol-binding protein [Gammaproteobacteria bacterium]